MRALMTHAAARAHGARSSARWRSVWPEKRTLHDAVGNVVL